ncbi:ribosome modulation factor [Pseudomonas nitroreducens]|uniref:ribosome modulation factor n=1 Tax=Pseudomonas nitroreducens TaxID=46680 RepID=UPI0028AC8BCF|nr:hypothetical protein [Pseudomonas nitroreducens]
MNNQAPLTFPERTAEYIEGAESRRGKFSRGACPYGQHMMFERSLWLAGWHDTDMAMTARRVA